MVRVQRTQRGRRALPRSQRGRASFTGRYRTTVGYRNSTSNTVSNYLKIARIILASLPISTLGSSILNFINVAFEFISKQVPISSEAEKTCVVGAYAMFGINPACLLFDSPLLAIDSDGSYNFPGHPVSMKHLRMRFKNVTKMSERSGKWAAVFIPYREFHDSTHYVSKIKDMTFTELAAMPYARVGEAHQDLIINYVMRNKNDYCARPREISEEIGICLVIWDNACRNSSVIETAFENAEFNCEIDIIGGCVPHIIFGPKHRVKYSAEKFKVRSVTTGEYVREHRIDGSVRRVKLEDFFASQSLRAMELQ